MSVVILTDAMGSGTIEGHYWAGVHDALTQVGVEVDVRDPRKGSLDPDDCVFSAVYHHQAVEHQHVVPIAFLVSADMVCEAGQADAKLAQRTCQEYAVAASSLSVCSGSKSVAKLWRTHYGMPCRAVLPSPVNESIFTPGPSAPRPRVLTFSKAAAVAVGQVLSGRMNVNYVPPLEANGPRPYQEHDLFLHIGSPSVCDSTLQRAMCCGMAIVSTPSGVLSGLQGSAFIAGLDMGGHDAPLAHTVPQHGAIILDPRLAKHPSIVAECLELAWEQRPHLAPRELAVASYGIMALANTFVDVACRAVVPEEKQCPGLA